jgi:hypothetical protein
MQHASWTAGSRGSAAAAPAELAPGGRGLHAVHRPQQQHQVHGRCRRGTTRCTLDGASLVPASPPDTRQTVKGIEGMQKDWPAGWAQGMAAIDPRSRASSAGSRSLGGPSQRIPRGAARAPQTARRLCGLPAAAVPGTALPRLDQLTGQVKGEEGAVEGHCGVLPGSPQLQNQLPDPSARTASASSIRGSDAGGGSMADRPNAAAHLQAPSTRARQWEQSAREHSAARLVHSAACGEGSGRSTAGPAAGRRSVRRQLTVSSSLCRFLAGWHMSLRACMTGPKSGPACKPGQDGRSGTSSMGQQPGRPACGRATTTVAALCSGKAHLPAVSGRRSRRPTPRASSAAPRSEPCCKGRHDPARFRSQNTFLDRACWPMLLTPATPSPGRACHACCAQSAEGCSCMRM